MAEGSNSNGGAGATAELQGAMTPEAEEEGDPELWRQVDPQLALPHLEGAQVQAPKSQH